MLLIVRLYIDGNIENEWDNIVNNFKNSSSKAIKPLYISLIKEKDFISVIFKVNRLDPLVRFLSEKLQDCKSVLGTRTLTLIKPVFLPNPKDRPDCMCRFTVALKVSTKYHHDLYNSLLNHKYKNDRFASYVSYSLGEWDILISMLTTSKSEAENFVENEIKKMSEIESYEIRTVVNSQHLTSNIDWRTIQKSLLHIPHWMDSKEMQNKFLYDYDLKMPEYCAMTCAMADEF